MGTGECWLSVAPDRTEGRGPGHSVCCRLEVQLPFFNMCIK